jgi:uncharacterized protein YndB with AHSA1/START domain
MTASPHATGRRADDGWIVLTRTFPAAVADVWSAVTDPDRMRRWIGTWTGDPASGQVAFYMTAEGEDVPAETVTIEACEPPHHLRMTSIDADGVAWPMRLDLTETDGGTVLAFAQQVTDADLAASVGPGWEYYLDRLVAVEVGADVGAVSFDDYYPALSDHYRALLS